MTDRLRLPATRNSITGKVEACGFKFYVTTSFVEDHEKMTVKPIEVFVVISKHGDVVSGVMDALAVSISIALQHGTPWEILRDKYKGTRFGRESEGHTSIVDAVAWAVDRNVAERRSQLGYDEEPGVFVPKPKKPDGPAPLAAQAHFVHAPDDIAKNGSPWWKTIDGVIPVTIGSKCHALFDGRACVGTVESDGVVTFAGTSHRLAPSMVYGSLAALKKDLDRPIPESAKMTAFHASGKAVAEVSESAGGAGGGD